MKIQPHELMIGNYVLINGKEYELNIKRFEYAVCKDRCKDIEPIPLTEGWLIKLDFVNYENKSEKFIKGNLIVFKNIKNELLIVQDNFYYKIVYVHLLQNIINTRKQLTKCQ